MGFSLPRSQKVLSCAGSKAAGFRFQGHGLQICCCGLWGCRVMVLWSLNVRACGLQWLRPEPSLCALWPIHATMLEMCKIVISKQPLLGTQHSLLHTQHSLLGTQRLVLIFAHFLLGFYAPLRTQSTCSPEARRVYPGTVSCSHGLEKGCSFSRHFDVWTWSVAAVGFL